jgi:hypothetical protein
MRKQVGKERDSASIESLQAENDELSAKLKDLSEALTTAELVNEELQDKLAKKPTVSASQLPKAEVNGVTYQFIAGKFRLDDKDYTAEEARDNTELLEKLVEIGFGGWEEVKD